MVSSLSHIGVRAFRSGLAPHSAQFQVLLSLVVYFGKVKPVAMLLLLTARGCRASFCLELSFSRGCHRKLFEQQAPLGHGGIKPNKRGSGEQNKSQNSEHCILPAPMHGNRQSIIAQALP
eukprot:3001378-Amphidinium_carterae.2